MEIRDNSSDNGSTTERNRSTHLQHQSTNLCRRAGDNRTSLLQSGCLIRRGTLTATDDGTGVTHTTTGRSGGTGDKADDRLGVGSSLVVPLQVFGCLFFHGTTDFTDKDDTFCSGVLQENLDDVDVLGTGSGERSAIAPSASLRVYLPGEGVTTDTDGQRLTETDQGGLVDGFVCKAGEENNALKR